MRFYNNLVNITLLTVSGILGLAALVGAVVLAGSYFGPLGALTTLIIEILLAASFAATRRL